VNLQFEFQGGILLFARIFLVLTDNTTAANAINTKMTASDMTGSSGTVAVGVGVELAVAVFEVEAEDVGVGDGDGELELEEVLTLPLITVALMGSDVWPEPGCA